MNLLDSINTIVPLFSEPNGVIRVGNTRVTLETLIYQFKNGSTAEEIVFQYPVLDLADVYAVIGFYLKHQTAVENYLLSSKVAVESIQSTVQQQFPATDLRQRLLNRQAQLPKITA
ncbi:DUF433 domain-containing protein [Haliscomenobacter sp.]|uniref:DUF433 domain-containing protein n=1 Tax=Haliscomenobacter sp. TaxID=2717303 RepID=UPI003593D860